MKRKHSKIENNKNNNMDLKKINLWVVFVDVRGIDTKVAVIFWKSKNRRGADWGLPLFHEEQSGVDWSCGVIRLSLLNPKGEGEKSGEGQRMASLRGGSRAIQVLSTLIATLHELTAHYRVFFSFFTLMTLIFHLWNCRRKCARYGRRY